jgi:hypothetical protein
MRLLTHNKDAYNTLLDYLQEQKNMYSNYLQSSDKLEDIYRHQGRLSFITQLMNLKENNNG